MDAWHDMAWGLAHDVHGMDCMAWHGPYGVGIGRWEFFSFTQAVSQSLTLHPASHPAIPVVIYVTSKAITPPPYLREAKLHPLLPPRVPPRPSPRAHHAGRHQRQAQRAVGRLEAAGYSWAFLVSQVN